MSHYLRLYMNYFTGKTHNYSEKSMEILIQENSRNNIQCSLIIEQGVIDAIKKKGYDVEKEGSKYAKKSLHYKKFDEAYTEYRVWKLLKGGS